MSGKIIEAIKDAIVAAKKDGKLKIDAIPPVLLDRPKKDVFGDYSTNIAMLIASKAGQRPRAVAELIVKEIGMEEWISKVEIAGPGFINIFMKSSYWMEILKEASSKGEAYGTSAIGAGKKVLLEFVSANPTGPLHVGHGRGAAVGDTLANILDAAGYHVTREFYINDAGNQVRNLAESIALKTKEAAGEDVEWGANHYKGEYIARLAERANELGIKDETKMGEYALDEILGWIKKDLDTFNIRFDKWFSERSLYEEGKVACLVEDLKGKGLIEEREGALWFCSMKFGDDKDRVVIRATGEPTYFASDIAYHYDKYQRGFSSLINIWGADHHGYIPRIKAVVEAFGRDRESLDVLLVQMVTILSGGKPVTMSKRAGEYITLRDVMDEVGSDATRFFFMMRKADAQMEFDLDLAKKQAPENPVFYVQYVHARINSIIKYAVDQGIDIVTDNDIDLRPLGLDEEIQVIKQIALFPEIIQGAALSLEPHRIVFYLIEMAGIFHPYYNKCRVVTDDIGLTKARLYLCNCVKLVIRNGLKLLGVSAPDKM